MTLPLAFNGNQITVRAERISLTDMWRAAGSPENREPYNWARFDGRRFIDAAQDILNLSEAQVLISKSGRRGGGTWAHWQIALAYAKYLSPDFHIWCNTVVRDRMEGVPATSAATITDIETHARSVIGGIVKGILHKELAVTLPALIQAELAGDRHRLVVDTMTVGEVLDQLGIQSSGRRALVNLVAARLSRYCKREGFIPRKTSTGRSGSSLYSPEIVLRWMHAEGKVLIAKRRAERKVDGDLFSGVQQ